MTRYGLKELFGNGPIESNAAGTQAHFATLSVAVASTLIAVSVPGSGTVENSHHPPASAATYQPGQQRTSAAVLQVSERPLGTPRSKIQIYNPRRKNLLTTGWACSFGSPVLPALPALSQKPSTKPSVVRVKITQK